MLKSWWKRLSEELELGEKKRNRTKAFQWLIIVGCVAVAMIVISSFVNVRQEVISPREPPANHEEADAVVTSGDKHTLTSIEDYEERMAANVSELLEKVVGMEQVSVQIQLQSTEVTVLEKNVVKKKQVTEEQDKQGGERTVTDTTKDQQVLTLQGKNGEEPIVIQRLKPDVKGIIIVAKGVENLEVKNAVMKAIRAYLDVPPHKIAILPKG